MHSQHLGCPQQDLLFAPRNALKWLIYWVDFRLCFCRWEKKWMNSIKMFMTQIYRPFLNSGSGQTYLNHSNTDYLNHQMLVLSHQPPTAASCSSQNKLRSAADVKHRDVASDARCQGVTRGCMRLNGIQVIAAWGSQKLIDLSDVPCFTHYLSQ